MQSPALSIYICSLQNNLQLSKNVSSWKIIKGKATWKQRKEESEKERESISLNSSFQRPPNQYSCNSLITRVDIDISEYKIQYF